MSEKLVMLSGRVPAELKEYVNNDPRDNQDVLRDALEREFATKEEAAILRRLDELDREMAELESQKNDRERKLEEKSEEKERLQKSLQSMEDATERRLESVLENAAQIPADSSHPFVVDKADTLNMDAEALAEEIAEYHDKEIQDDGGL